MSVKELIYHCCRFSILCMHHIWLNVPWKYFLLWIILHCLNISEIDHYCTLTNYISSFTNCLLTHLHFANKGPHSESYGFPSNHVQMLQLDHKNGWALKNSCFWNVVKTLESPLDSKEIKPVNPEGNQHRIFTGRTVTEAPILWPPDTKRLFIGKDSHAGKDWGQEKKGSAEDEMIGWHHQINGHEFEQTQGDSEGQESLACCSLWGPKQSDVTYRLNNDTHFPLGLLSFLYKYL